MTELRAAKFVARLLDEEQLDPNRYKRMLTYRLGGDSGLKWLDASSKLNAKWAFLVELHERGH